MLINRDGSKVFDSLQEISSQEAYGTVLGRLVCFYLRLDALEDTEENEDLIRWRSKYLLMESIQTKLMDVQNQLEIYSGTDEEWERSFNVVFHEVIYSFFCWTESRTLLEEGFCAIQRFLMVICLCPNGNGFINTRDITPLIAKLMYCIRGCIFAHLMWPNNDQVALEDDLAGHQIYVKDLIQSPFGLLYETQHLASTIVGMSNALPSISWIGEEYKSLAIHGKRVDLSGLQRFCRKLLNIIKRKFNNDIKMGLPGLREFNWNTFNPKDDLSNTTPRYSFINKGFDGQRRCLLDQFLQNKATDEYFTRGRNGKQVLWNVDNCCSWLKKCREFMESLSVEIHFVAGQPDRSTEAATLRIENTSEELRGIYWDNDTILLLGQYSKTRSITGRDRLIPR
jgi:hypothetical protein